MAQTVLIIEAQRGIRDLLVSLIDPAGPVIHLASDGEQGMLIFDTINPDYVVVSSETAGSMDVFSLCRKMRARGGDAVRILVVGTKGMPFESAAALAAGADAHIGHPFGRHEFENVVSALVGQGCACPG